MLQMVIDNRFTMITRTETVERDKHVVVMREKTKKSNMSKIGSYLTM